MRVCDCAVFLCVCASMQAWVCVLCVFASQEVGGTLTGEDGLMVKAGVELVEWYQTFAPFWTLL